MKRKPKEETPETGLATPTESKAADEIPVEFKQIEGKTPEEILQTMLPHLRIETIAALMSGIGFELPVPIPEWAKNASRQLMKYYFPNRLNPFDSIKDAGVLAGLAERIQNETANRPKTGPTPEYAKLLNAIGKHGLDYLEKDARAKSPDETAQFYAGRANAMRVFEKMSNPQYLTMQKRAPIYFCICILWQQFEKFKSGAEAERWMRANKVIGETVHSREVAAVFKLVGLHYRGPGRPQKEKTDAAISDNQDSAK